MAKDEDGVSTAAERKGRKAVALRAKRLERLEVEYVAVADLKPNNYNPNRQSERDFELLVKSMREDGFTQPIVVQAGGNIIVDGEHRWRAARELELEEIPVVFVEMSDEQMRVSTLRHNRARGSEDFDLAADVLRDLRDLGALEEAQDALMLTDEDVTLMLDDIPALELLAEDEFTEAWEPGAKGTKLSSGERKKSSGVVTEGLTPDAADAVREQERLEREAKTEEERQARRKDADIYRLSFIYTGDEGKIIRTALGTEEAAVELLTLCTAELKRREGADDGEGD